MKKRLFISFSGGETSAMMTEYLLNHKRDMYSDVVTVFANTGQENEETLEFIRDCDATLGFNTVWVEAVINPESGAGTTHKIVNFDTADRSGVPFEEMIKKYGIPNTKAPHCTRELKQRAMASYIASLGWKKGEYETAIGIRADESHRRSPNAEASGLVYPLLDWAPTTKPQVNLFWREQSFRLRLAGYQGNCRWCWKKSLRKLLTIMELDPSVFDFPERMESTYGLVGPEFKKEYRPGYRRTFFRQNMSVQDLRRVYEENKDSLLLAKDDSVFYEHQLLFFDVEPGDGCTESCEVLWEDTA